MLSEFAKKENIFIIANEFVCKRIINAFPNFFEDRMPINDIHIGKDESRKKLYDLTKEDIKQVGEALYSRHFGHDDFKDDFLEKLEHFPILYKIGSVKILSVFLCGGSGIGKTEIAWVLHDTVYKGCKPIKINLGNYKTTGAINSLIGSPLGYIGSENGGELSNKINKSDSRIILIDEFEKADTDIFNFFYELLEEGKFTDLADNEFDLEGYLIIFTTNLNATNYKEKIPVPILSRFSLKYEFVDLSNYDKLRFIDCRLNDINFNYKKEYGKEIDVSTLKNNILSKKIDIITDLRAINRIIEKEIVNYISTSCN